MSSRYCLPLRHDFIAKFVYEKSAKKANPDCNLVYNENQFIKKEAQIKFWWNVSIITAAKVKFNKTDSLICGRNKKTCKLVQFNFSADVKVTKKTQEKDDNYGPLVCMYK